MSLCGEHILSWLTFVPLIGAALIALTGKNNERSVKLIALVASLTSLMLALIVWYRFDPSAGLNFEETFLWVPILNVSYRLGVDGLSITMVLLTAIITPLALLASWKQDREVKLFFSLFLMLETGMFGVFTALNFFHWFIFWELGLIPMFFSLKSGARKTGATRRSSSSSIRWPVASGCFWHFRSCTWRPVRSTC